MIARYTSLGMNRDTSDLLQQLVQVNIESRDNHRAAAERTQDERLQSVLRAVAMQRDNHARALQSILWSNSEPAGGSRPNLAPAGGTRRSALPPTHVSPDALFDEILKGEEHVEQQYIRIKEVADGRAIRQLLQEQLKAVSFAGHRIGMLRADRRP